MKHGKERGVHAAEGHKAKDGIKFAVAYVARDVSAA
jgi:hypothetical protein